MDFSKDNCADLCELMLCGYKDEDLAKFFSCTLYEIQQVKKYLCTYEQVVLRENAKHKCGSIECRQSQAYRKRKVRLQRTK